MDADQESDGATKRRSDEVETVGSAVRTLRFARTFWSARRTLLLLLVATGCSQALQPIFEQHEPELVWPPAPAPARIRYVGQLATAADLKPPPQFFEGLATLLAGEKKVESLYGPRSAVTVDDGRRMWVADAGGRRLVMFDLEARTLLTVTRAGKTPLLTPVDVCAGPQGSIYVCDSEAEAVYRFRGSDGAFEAVLQTPEELARPVAVYYDAETGELLVADAVMHDIKVLAPDGRLKRILGRRGERPGEFNFPTDLVVAGGVIWVADAGNNRVQGITPAGEPVAAFGSAGDAPGDLALPKGIAADRDGHLYVVDARFENVQIFDRRGALLLFFGQEGAGPGEFALPAGIHIDARNRIWVCDSYNGRVQAFDYVPEAATTASRPAQGGEP